MALLPSDKRTATRSELRPGAVLNDATEEAAVSTDHTDALRGLRVVVWTNSVAMGGVEEHVRQLASGLAEREAAVTVILPEEAALDPLAAALGKSGVAVERVTLARNMSNRSGVRRLIRVVRLLRELRPELLHVHLVGPGGGRRVLLAARLARVPAVVCTVHITPSERQGWRRRLGQSVTSRFISRYIAVSRTSGGKLVRFLGLPSRMVDVVPNAVELHRFDAPASPARRGIREALGIPIDAPVIGVLSRLSHQKGLSHLVAAMPAILAAHPLTHLLLVGDGPLHEELLAQARRLEVDHRVHFAGFRTNTVEFLRAMDLFVLPSLYEGMPLSLLEAMAAALPVVATAVDGTPEVVLDGKSGILVPPADPGALAEAVISALNDPAQLKAMGRCGRARAEEFSHGAFVDRHGDVYRVALSR